MKLSVEFPSVAYREGPGRVVELAKAIEEIGFDDLAMFDHVVMGHATATRRARTRAPSVAATMWPSVAAHGDGIGQPLPSPP